jgi:hypothetical protein
MIQYPAFGKELLDSIIMQNLEGVIERLRESQEQFALLMDEIDRHLAEYILHQRVASYLAMFLRQRRVLLPYQMDPSMEDDLISKLSDEEYADFLWADTLVSGYPRYLRDAPLIWLLVEVSAVVKPNDVERARRRTNTLKRAGYRAIPVVVSERVTAEAKEAAQVGHVLLVQDDAYQFWDEALAAALTS